MDVSLWLTLATAIIAAISAFAAFLAIHKDNKQFLFDKRLKIYGLLMEMIDNCNDSKGYLKEPFDLERLADCIYETLTKSPSFHSIQSLAYKTTIKSNDKFDKKIQELNAMFYQSRAIIKGKNKQYICLFMRAYIDTLICFKEQCGRIQRYQAQNGKIPGEVRDNHHAKQHLKNGDLKINLDILYYSYDVLQEKNCIEYLEKQINLI